MNSTKYEERYGFLHVYPQPAEHGSAFIQGTKEGLLALRDAIDAALVGGVNEASAMVFAADGEGYHCTVQCVNVLDTMGWPFYRYNNEENE